MKFYQISKSFCINITEYWPNRFFFTAILGYSVTAPGSFSYAYSGYNYPYHYPVAKAIPFHPAPVAYPAAVYPATTYAAHAYPSYPEDDGQYWPGKYEKIEVPAYKAVHPSYAGEDDGQYWPGKYEKVDASAYKAEHHYWIISQQRFSTFRGQKARSLSYSSFKNKNVILIFS